MRVRLASSGVDVELDPEHGGRVSSLIVDGMELLVTTADSPLGWGCYPMAPFAGRVRNGRFKWSGTEHQLEQNLAPHAIHGTVFDRAWRVEHAEPTDAVLVTDLGPDWPFGGRVVHRVRVTEDSLDLRLEVWAHDEPFPASCGWHPWWRRQLSRGEPVEIELAAGSVWARDADGLPSGELVAPGPAPWNDCFTDLVQLPVLRWDGALELSLETSCLDVVVFDELDHAVAVEPQTGPPDALRLAPVIVEPGLPLVAEATFSWKTL